MWFASLGDGQTSVDLSTYPEPYLLFLADEGLYEVDLLTYSPRLLMAIDTLPTPTDIQQLGAANETTLMVWATSRPQSPQGGVEFTRVDIRRPQTICKDGTSSTLGSGLCEACHVAHCASTARRILECTPCSPSPSCPRGTFLTPCTPGADAMCTPCEQHPGMALIPGQEYNWLDSGGTCTPGYVRPCPVGYWGEDTCAKCPENTYAAHGPHRGSPTAHTAATATQPVCVSSLARTPSRWQSARRWRRAPRAP